MHPNTVDDTPTTPPAQANSAKYGERACQHHLTGNCGLCFPPPGLDFEFIHTGRHYRPGPPRDNTNTPAGKHERAP